MCTTTSLPIPGKEVNYIHSVFFPLFTFHRLCDVQCNVYKFGGGGVKLLLPTTFTCKFPVVSTHLRRCRLLFSKELHSHGVARVTRSHVYIPKEGVA